MTKCIRCKDTGLVEEGDLEIGSALMECEHCYALKAENETLRAKIHAFRKEIARRDKENNALFNKFIEAMQEYEELKAKLKAKGEHRVKLSWKECSDPEYVQAYIGEMHEDFAELLVERDALKAQLEEANKLIANLTEQRDTYVKMANLEAKSEPVAWYLPENKRHQTNSRLYIQLGVSKPPIHEGWKPLYASPQAINEQLLVLLKEAADDYAEHCEGGESDEWLQAARAAIEAVEVKK